MNHLCARYRSLFAIVLASLIFCIGEPVVAGSIAKNNQAKTQKKTIPKKKNKIKTLKKDSKKTTGQDTRKKMPAKANENANQAVFVNQTKGRQLSGKSKKSKKKQKRDTRNVVYVVQKGDSLGKIAKKFRIKVSEIKKLNKMKGNTIRPGMKLVVKTVVGGGNKRLSDGIQLQNGPGYFVMNPDESWGKEVVIDSIHTAFLKIVDMYPGTVDGIVGDISLHNGGYFPPHKSHRDGLDVDIGIYMKNNKPIKNFSKAKPEEVDYEKTWDFIWALLESGQVEVIYVDYSHQAKLYESAKKEGMDEETMQALFQYPDGRGVRKGVIRHWSGHRGHLHVRFKGAPKDKFLAEIDHSMRQRLSDIRPKLSSSHVRLNNVKSHLAN